MLTAAGNRLILAAEELNHLDAVIGDGDHGITMKKIAECMISYANKDYQRSNELFADLGLAILSTPGGSACTLYGIFLGGFLSEQKDDEFNVKSMKEMIFNGYQQLRNMSGAKVGDKTMMDALVPAIQTLEASDGDAATILRQAAESAKSGAEGSKGYVAKYGRAKNYKERTIGFPDPGAVSMTMLFEGFAAALEVSK